MANTTGPVQLLSDEHRQVLAKLEAMETIFQDLDHKEEHAAELQALMAFFKASFWVHFDKEEQAFFPEFDNFMPHGMGPLAVMTEEHGVLRDTNDVLQEAVSLYLGIGDSEGVRKTVRESGMHFIEYLKSHIAKEDKLFPQLAAMHLGADQNARILKRYGDIEHRRHNQAGGSPKL